MPLYFHIFSLYLRRNIQWMLLEPNIVLYILLLTILLWVCRKSHIGLLIQIQYTRSAYPYFNNSYQVPVQSNQHTMRSEEKISIFITLACKFTLSLASCGDLLLGHPQPRASQRLCPSSFFRFLLNDRSDSDYFHHSMQ